MRERGTFGWTRTMLAIVIFMSNVIKDDDFTIPYETPTFRDIYPKSFESVRLKFSDFT